MGIAYRLTPELRAKLKEPIGTLIRGSFAETMSRFKSIVDDEHPPCIISVGDTVSKNLASIHISPNLAIVDNKAMRKNIQPISLVTKKTIYIKNSQATISEEAIMAIRDTLKTTQHIKMVVEGEEDLLALIAILYAPEKAYVIYGQPYEGIVITKVTPEKKNEVQKILDAMERGSKS